MQSDADRHIGNRKGIPEWDAFCVQTPIFSYFTIVIFRVATKEPAVNL